MNWLPCNLGIIANLAAILTAVIAVFGYSVYRWDRRKQRQQLEKYLREEKEKKVDHGQRSLLHLMVNVGMTESELIQASFRSKNIVRKIAKDEETGRAGALLLEWKE